MTLLESAKKGIITDIVKTVAEYENQPPEKLVRDIASGRTVIIKSANHNCRPVGIGRDLRIKVNANIGTSDSNPSIDTEIEKLEAAVSHGADIVMDLSTGGDIAAIRKRLIARSEVPIGSVPIYETIVNNPDVSDITEEDFLDSIKNHIEDGMDFITVHCGLTKSCIPYLESRRIGIVSRGGSFLVKWMLYHNKENPLYTHFDRIIDMAKKHDVVLSLGDGLRPGCLADATDNAQIEELKNLGSLAKRAKTKGVQVIIEGPGHVPLDQIEKNIILEKTLCNGAPFYVLGPLVTDIAAGYDHIVGAIGGALAGYYGADLLCYLTPKEHLGLPDKNDVIDGVIASKIAAHVADIARGTNGAQIPDDRMADARASLNWKDIYSNSMYPDKARSIRNQNKSKDDDVCSMCGSFCAAKINKECKEKYKG